MLSRRALLGLGISAAATAASADTPFCAGFKAGWASAFENRNLIPQIPPICPIPPIGGDTYQAGYEMGLLAALRQISQRRY